MKKLKRPLPKLRKPKRRVRRSPYGRALDLATKRHEKAVAEYTKCQLRIAALEEEMPRLEEMVRVLEGYINGDRNDSPPAPPPVTSLDRIPLREKPLAPVPQVANGLPQSLMERVPAHLRHMIPTHPSLERINQAGGGVGTMRVGREDDEDRFLPNVTGTEILP
jgi:hypothetical protein